jgi:hypothetical protein
MRWLIQTALREAKSTRARGLLMLFSMVFGLTVLVSFSSIKQGFQDSFYEIATILSGGDLRIEIIGKPTERLRHLLPRLGDRREAYYGTQLRLDDAKEGPEFTAWFAQMNPLPKDDVSAFVDVDLPASIPVSFTATDSQAESLGIQLDGQASRPIFVGESSIDANWGSQAEESLPIWVKRIKRESRDRLYGNTVFLEQILGRTDLDWEQVWVFHFDDASIDDRIARAKYVLEYLLEESQGVRFIHELPDETGFYHSFRTIANTLFLAAFSALMLGTLAYTVTFVDFARGKTNHAALMRCLGSSMLKSWAVYGFQVLGYAAVSVVLAGLISVGVQLLIPLGIEWVTGIPVEIEIYWRALVISLVFGGCFMLLPGFVAIIPLLGCEPVEVLRSVKMPARQEENRWIQAILMVLTVLLAIGFCLQMIEDSRFAVVYLFSMVVVFFCLLSGVLGLRKLIKRLVEFRRTYALAQASSNLFRAQNHYVFTLTSISFGLFLITFLYVFFEGFATKGVHEIAGYGSISDERVAGYLEWLQKVFFLNQFMGVTLLIIGLLAVFVLLTAQRRTRLYEAVVLGTLGAEDTLIRKIMIYESIFAGAVTSILGPLGGLVFGAIVFGLFFDIPIIIPWWMLALLVSLTIGVMVGMGFANMKGILGHPPLEVLRRRRHFDNW